MVTESYKWLDSPEIFWKNIWLIICGKRLLGLYLRIRGLDVQLESTPSANNSYCLLKDKPIFNWVCGNENYLTFISEEVKLLIRLFWLALVSIEEFLVSYALRWTCLYKFIDVLWWICICDHVLCLWFVAFWLGLDGFSLLLVGRYSAF